MRVKRTDVAVVLVSGLIAFVGCLPVFDLVQGDDWDGMLALLALPGVYVTGMLAGVTKAFNAWLIFGFTWIVYAMVFFLLLTLYRTVRWASRED